MCENKKEWFEFQKKTYGNDYKIIISINKLMIDDNKLIKPNKK